MLYVNLHSFLMHNYSQLAPKPAKTQVTYSQRCVWTYPLYTFNNLTFVAFSGHNLPGM